MLATSSLRNADAFLSRILSESLERPIMFVLGSPLTAPEAAGARGVPGVTAIIELVRERLRGFCDLDPYLSGPSDIERYQQALEVLQAFREDPTRLIRRAVLMDRIVEDLEEEVEQVVRGDLSACDLFENDLENWHLATGLEALGKIIAGAPDVFGRVVLTSNFDPLIEISVRRAGGQAVPIRIDSDAPPDIVGSTAPCRVIHFHGFWSGSGTLHRPEQLKHTRPQLFDAICGYLKQYTCVVLAYGGWDDIFMEAIRSVLQSRHGSPNVLWAHFNSDPAAVARQQSSLLKEFDQIAVLRERFVAYYGINVNDILPRLFDRLGKPEPYHGEVRKREFRVPAADETVSPAEGRVLAFASQDTARTTPYYPDTLWGIDRGRFLGLLDAAPNSGIYAALVQIEGQLQRATAGHAELSDLPLRWWLRFDAARLVSASDPLQSLGAAALDTDDPRLRYLRAKGLPPGIQLGAFLVMPDLPTAAESFHILKRCIAGLQRAVDGGRLTGTVAQWSQITNTSLGELLEESKRLWPSIAVDALVTGPASSRAVAGQTYCCLESMGRLNDQSETHRPDLLRAAERAVEKYAQGTLFESSFLRDYGVSAFAQALRRGLDFPAAVKFSSKTDLYCADFWWLVTRLEATPERLLQIMSLAVSRRAVWGLVTATEWNNLPRYLQVQILDARQGRPLVFD